MLLEQHTVRLSLRNSAFSLTTPFYNLQLQLILIADMIASLLRSLATAFNIQGLALHPLPVTEWLARPCSRTISLVALRSVEFPPHVILHCSQDLSFDLLLVILFSYSFVCFFACCSVCKLDLYSPRLYRSLQILLSVGFNISRGSKNGNPTYIKDQQYTVVVSV